MKSAVILSSLVSVGLLSACSPGFQPLGMGTSSSSSQASAVQENAVSNKILDDVAANLRQGSATTGLSEAEIQALIENAKSSLQAGGLTSTTNLQALLPGVLGSLTQSIGKLRMATGSSLQVSTLLSTIGTSVLGSATNLPPGLAAGLSGVTSKEDLMALISKSLFQNLPVAGVSTGNLPQVAGSVMSQLVAHLGKQGLPTSSLSTLLQSLTSGATLGVGNLNLGSIGNTQFANILNQIGLGSAQGLSGVQNATASADVLQALLGNVVNGATQGLNQSAGAKAGMNVSALLTSLINGQATGLSNSGLPSTKQKAASLFLQLLLSKI